MEFSKEQFADFSKDLDLAIKDLCDKYKIKSTKSKLTYSEAEFDINMTFENLESEVPAEQVCFEADCEYYGFDKTDYLKRIKYKDQEYEFIGFKPGAKKYKCLARNLESGEVLKFTTDLMKYLLEESTTYPICSKEEFDALNTLTEKELSFLQIKLEKSKRSERDWTQIKETLKDKYMFSYIPAVDNAFARNVDDMAVENGYAHVYMDRQLLEDRLNLLGLFGKVGRETMIRAETFEVFLTKAKKNNVPIIFDFIEPPQGRYYMFLPESDTLSVQYIV